MSSHQQQHHQQTSSRTSDFIRASGEVQDKKLWGPAKWVVQLIQYLIAIMLVTISEAFKSIFTGESPSARREKEGQSTVGGKKKA